MDELEMFIFQIWGKDGVGPAGREYTEMIRRFAEMLGRIRMYIAHVHVPCLLHVMVHVTFLCLLNSLQ